MAIEFVGEEWFPQPPQVVVEKLTDLPLLVTIFPDVDQVSVSEPDRLVFKVRPGFSFIRGTLENTVRILEQTAETAILEVKGKGIGTSVTVLVELAAAAKTGGEPPLSGSAVAWKATITEMGGLLKAVSRGLIEGAARQVIAQAWSAFHRKILS